MSLEHETGDSHPGGSHDGWHDPHDGHSTDDHQHDHQHDHDHDLHDDGHHVGWASAPSHGDMPNYDPSTDAAHVVGDPASALDHWHQQARPDSCAVVSQEFVLEQLTGIEFSEDQLVHIAEANGWYTPGGGTPMYDVGRLIEAQGIPVERVEGASMQDLQHAVEQGSGVIVGVDAHEIWQPGRDAMEDDLLGDIPGIPGQDANHAVTVIGFDYSDPDHPNVILNDPGHPEGQGLLVPVDEFEDAWRDSGHYMVVAGGESSSQQSSQPSLPTWGAEQPTFAGYSNADGTYHWTSDNTDTDPETGAVVRQW